MKYSWKGRKTQINKKKKKKKKKKCRKDQDHDLRYGPGPSAEFRRVSMCHLSHWRGQQHYFLQWLLALGAQEMHWAQALDKGPWLQMYTVPGNCTPHGSRELHAPWTANHRGKSKSDHTSWRCSFLLLPRRHALRSRWLWSFNHNTCENHLEEVQGAATSSVFTLLLFQDTWPCVQLLCAERNAPCQWDLAIDRAKYKQCRPWSDAAEHSIWSGSTLFANVSFRGQYA